MRTLREVRVLLAACCTLAACHNRIPVPADEAGPPTADAGVDGPIVVPDGPPPDAHRVCRKEATPLQSVTDPRGNFTLAVPERVQVRIIGIDGAPRPTAAATLDDGEVAAFVATRSAEGSDPVESLAEFQQRVGAMLEDHGLGTVVLRASGARGTSAEGNPDVKEAVWDIASPKAVAPAYLRNWLIAVATNRGYGELVNLPSPGGRLTTSLVLKVTLVARTDQIVVNAAVTDRASYDAPTSPVAVIAEDLANGTAVAAAGRSTSMTCDVGPITGRAVADIIWVVDESNSMSDNRQDIVNNANKFFAKAIAAGLDFRMGVVGVKDPGKAGVTLGKFCSSISTDPADDGGEDRFLGPNEQATFSSCVKNPPYHELGAEFGLTHGYHAVLRHLPRAANHPAKIRPEAKLALIFVTDEAPHELKQGTSYGGKEGFLSYADYRSTGCHLDEKKQQTLEEFITPWTELFSGAESPEARATVHLIGGVCSNTCRAEMAYGYQELARRFGGQVGDVCQADLSPTLQVIVDSIVASASPRVLGQRPISSTLTVEVNGLRLPRSHQKGFAYNATSNALSFINVGVNKGNQVVASYRRFEL